LGKRELKRLAHRLADCITSEFMNLFEHKRRATGDMSFAVIYSYGRAAWLVSHLKMIAPGWGKYCPEALTDIDALRAMARLESSAWWLRRLTRVRNEWREHLMIAAGYVSKKGGGYCSEMTLKEWLAHRKSNIEYIKAMELEDTETGERTSLADKVLKSTSNPQNRRRELMTRIRGFEDIANAEGLAGEFYTLTAPSRYHAMHEKAVRVMTTGPKRLIHHVTRSVTFAAFGRVHESHGAEKGLSGGRTTPRRFTALAFTVIHAPGECRSGTRDFS
jgi:hypothetical protein